MQQGQWAAALGCFLDAARESPNDLEVWTHVAVAAHKQGAHLVALQVRTVQFHDNRQQHVMCVL